jgi:hypothetical protein
MESDSATAAEAAGAGVLLSREGRRRKEPWIERDDVTNAILYVESDAGRFATGTTISVDLGLRAK